MEVDLGSRAYGFTCRLHCSSFLGYLIGNLIIYLVKPKKGTTMETIGRAYGFRVEVDFMA